MPILIVALVALGAFGMIGILLLTAMILENRKHKHHTDSTKLPLASFPLVKH
jgi:hypothetical protein